MKYFSLSREYRYEILAFNLLTTTLILQKMQDTTEVSIVADTGLSQSLFIFFSLSN